MTAPKYILQSHKTIVIFRADQLAAHQMYGQSGPGSEPQIDQTMHQRSEERLIN